MSARYLLDTDWVIHYLNANAAVVERVVSDERPNGVGP